MRISARLMTAIAILNIWLVGIVGAQSPPTQQENQALAPTGKLRAALYLGGPTNVIKDPTTGEMKGEGTR